MKIVSTEWRGSALPTAQAFWNVNSDFQNRRLMRIVEVISPFMQPHATDTHSEIQNFIRSRHGCGSSYLNTMRVEESWDGKDLVVLVEVFALHEQICPAQYCYAWKQTADKGPDEIVTVLQIPPVISPRSAVVAALRAAGLQPLRRQR